MKSHVNAIVFLKQHLYYFIICELYTVFNIHRMGVAYIRRKHLYKEELRQFY